MRSPGGTLLPDRMMSPTDGVRDLHVEMLTKQLVDLQQRVKQLEGDNNRLREQVSQPQGAHMLLSYIRPALYRRLRCLVAPPMH